jgi:hypothetical protein
MLIAVEIALLTVCVLVFLYLGRGRPYFAWFRFRIDSRIARNVAVSSEWVEVEPWPPLRVKKRRTSVNLVIEGFDYQVDKNAMNAGNPEGITFYDGRIVTPEVQIEDDHGKCYRLYLSEKLHSGAAFTRDGATYGHRLFPRETVFRKIRIKSDKPFNCSEIIWHCHSTK